MTESPRVLFINRMAGMVRGGGETFDLEMARHLQSLECKPAVLTGLPLVGSARISLDNHDHYTIRTPYLGWLPWDRFKGGWRLRVMDFKWFEQAAVSWVLKKQQDFDIIQVCELPFFVDAWKQKGTLPVVMRVTAPDLYDPVDGLTQADAVVASGASMKVLREKHRPDTFDIPNGVDTEMFYPHPSPYRAQSGISNETFVVLLVARFQTVKNHQMLINAFNRLRGRIPDAILLLAGSGPLEGSARRKVAALHLEDHVRFLGEVPYHDLPDLYAASDLKVLSSDYESFCFAVLEAMASGLPLVVTETDWIPGLLGHGKGGNIVPCGDADRFGDAMVELGLDNNRREEMGAWNRKQTLEQHSWESSARKLLELYNSFS